MPITKWKKPIGKGCVAPAVWCSGEGKATEILERCMVESDGAGLWGDEWAEHRGLSEKWKYSVWWSLYFCPNTKTEP